MRAVVLIVAAAILGMAPMAMAQTNTPNSADATETTGVSPEAPTAETDDATAEAEPEPELVCRNMIVRSESRLRSARERVCRTQAQWDALDERAGRGRNNNSTRNAN